MESKQPPEINAKERKQVEIEIRRIVEQMGLDTTRSPIQPIESIEPQEPDSTDPCK